MSTSVRLATLAAFVALGIAATGCAQAPTGLPEVAYATPASVVDETPTMGCSPEGLPRVVATHVAPTAGVRVFGDGGHVWLRYATTYDARVATALDASTLDAIAGLDRPVETTSPTEGPVEVSLAGGARLVAWTEGSIEDGRRVKVVAVGKLGTSLGPEVDLGYEGSAYGRPAVAVAADGRGVLAFIESSGAGYHLVAVRLECRVK